MPPHHSSIRTLVFPELGEPAEWLIASLRSAGFRPHCNEVDTISKYSAALDPALDIILFVCRSDAAFHEEAMLPLHERGLDVPVIAIGRAPVEQGLGYIEQGAADYVRWNELGRLGFAVARAIELRQLRDGKQRMERALQTLMNRTEALSYCNEIFFESSRSPMFIHDGETDILLAVNRAAVEHFGYSRSEFLAMRIEQLLVSETLTEAAGPRADCTPPFANLQRCRAKTGKEAIGYVTTHPITYMDRPAVLRVVDVTDLGGGKTWFRSICEASPVGIFVMDPDGSCDYMNPQARTLNGLDLYQRVARDWVAALHPADRERVTTEWAAALQTRQPFVSTHRLLRADGTALWVSVKAVPAEEGSGVTGYVGVIDEITERVRVEEELRAAQFELQIQKERIDDLLSTVPGVVWEAWGAPNTVQQINFVNNYVETLLGYSVEEWLATPNFWLKIVHPDDRQRTVKDAAEIYSGNPVKVTEFRYVAKDEREGWIESHFVIIRDKSGAPVGIRGVSIDTTERRKAEEAARGHKELLQTIFDHIPVMITCRDAEMRLQFANREWERVLGWSSSDYRNQVIKSFLYPDPEERERREAFIRVADGSSADFQIRTRDGRILHTRWIAHRLSDGSTISLGRDVTERKEWERQISEQAQLLHLAHDAISVRDLDDCVHFWNRGAEKLFGWTAEKMMGADVKEVLHAHQPGFRAAREAVLANGEWQGEMTLFAKGNHEIIVRASWTLLRDEADEPKSVLVIETNITEQKSLEARFLHAQRLESIGTLASGVAHDLNNILSPILMAAPLLREGLPPAELESLVTTIETSAQRGANIVKQVLTFARGIEGDRVPLQPKHLIHEVERMAMETFPKNIAIRNDIAPELRLIEGDTTQLHQVLLNLCVNARDAMPNGGILTISAENFHVDENYAAMLPGAHIGDYVQIAVRDTGSGIPREIINKIFDPFFTTKGPGKGTGLGLSTVLGIVKAHHGFLNLYSEVECGTTFKVFLPVCSNAVGCTTAHEESTVPLGNGERILVVDDESGLRSVTETILRKHGYETVLASDGAEAIAIYAQRRDEIDLVLTDVMMPLMDGVALSRALRHLNPHVRIIASTGQAEETRREELRSLKVETLLTKPYNTPKLLRAIHESLHLTPHTN